MVLVATFTLNLLNILYNANAQPGMVTVKLDPVINVDFIKKIQFSEIIFFQNFIFVITFFQ